LLLPLLLVLFALATGTSEGETACKIKPTVAKAIKLTQRTTQRTRAQLGLKPYPISTIPVVGCRYAVWVLHLWQRRSSRLESYTQWLEQADRDFTIAAHLASRAFRTTYRRLYYRAGVEGGHGEWRCNHHGSGACGWFQFMEGTYYSYSYRAFVVSRKRGFPISYKYQHWRSLLGQTVTAAYMFELGLECSHVGWAASC
jgi:hypothetical protein